MRIAHAFLCSLLLACAASPASVPPPSSAAEPASAAATAPSSAPDPECLAHADGLDGQVDHVIGRCPNCGLTMDGKPEFASTLGEYTAHSCSASCKDALEADPAKVIARSCKK